MKETKTTDPREVKRLLKDELSEILGTSNSQLNMETKPSVIVVVGVNGVGKTTSIGK